LRVGIFEGKYGNGAEVRSGKEGAELIGSLAFVLADDVMVKNLGASDEAVVHTEAILINSGMFFHDVIKQAKPIITWKPQKVKPEITPACFLF
jgi:hypothetical protein